MNNVVVIGRLVADPEIRFIQGSGMAVANFKLAVDKGLSREKKAEFESQGKRTCDFIPVVVWGKQAENCSQYLSKGRLVAIQGSIQTGSYKKDDSSVVYTTDVLASNVQFLEWGEKKEEKKEEKNDDVGFEEDDDEDACPF